MRGANDVEDLRVQRRLAAGDLQQVGLPFALDQQIEHGLDLREAARSRLGRRGAGEAGRAFEVAMLVDLDQGQAAVLLVVGTEPAIVGAPLVDAGMEFERHIPGFEEIPATLPIARLARHQCLLDAVFGAALQVIDRAALLDDLRRHQTHAGLAERGGLAEKDVGPRLARRGDQVLSG